MVVAVVALVTGTAAVTLLLSSDAITASSDSPSTTPQPSATATTRSPGWPRIWMNGARQTWTMEAPDNASDSLRIHRIGDKLVYIVSEGGSLTINVFRLGDGTPEQLWQDTVKPAARNVTIWNNQVVVGNTVLNVDTHERTTAPWSADSEIWGAVDGLSVCTGTTCQVWTSLTEKKWETTIPVPKQAHLSLREKRGGYALAGGSGRSDPHFAVNTETGEAKLLDGSAAYMASVTYLADGWLIYDNGQVTI